MNEMLIILLLVCHWLGDFSHLQTSWMLQAKAKGKPLLPIFIHAAVHALLMGICLFFFAQWQTVWLMALLQLISHFILDAAKGRLNILFPKLQMLTNQSHWLVFGADQMLHHSIIVYMAWYTSNHT